MADARNSGENGSSMSARKRREVDDTNTSTTPIKKKIKLEEDEPPVANPNTMEGVREKNKAMAIDLLEKNRRICFLSQKCGSLYRQNVVSQSSFRCIQRQWTQLLDEISSASRMLGETASDDVSGWQDVSRKSELLGVLKLPREALDVSLPEWFVAVSTSEKDKEKEETPASKDDDNAHDLEGPAKSQLLTEAEKQVETELQNDQKRLFEVLQRLVTALSSSSSEPKELDVKQLVAQKRDATSHALSLKDQLEAMAHKITDLEADLEYKETERHQACRDYDRLRQYVEKTSAAADAASSSNSITPKNSERTTDDKINQAAAVAGGADRQQGNEEAATEKDQKEKRVTLVEPETTQQQQQQQKQQQKQAAMDREQYRKMHENQNILVNKLKEERQKIELMRVEQTRLHAMEAAWKQEDARIRYEHAAQVGRFQDEIVSLKEQLIVAQEATDKHKEQTQDEWKNQLEKTQHESSKIKAKVDELVTKNAALRDKLASLSVYRDQLSDLKSHHESLKRETSRLKDQLQREKARKDRVRAGEEKKEVVLLREQLARTEKDRDELRGGGQSSSGGAAAATTSMESKPALETQLAELQAELEKTRVDLETANMNQDAFKDENDALVSEIEVLGKEIESMRHSKKKVIKQLEEKRHAARKLQTEITKESDAKAHSGEELANVRLQVSSLKYVHTQQKATLEAAKEAIKASTHELDELKKYVSLLESERDAATLEKIKAQRDAETATQMYKAESFHKQRQVLQDKARACDQCESYRKKQTELEKKLSAVAAARSSSSSTNGAGGRSGDANGLADLERFELQDLQKQLKCSVCQDRHKDVILSKCFHMFCKECVDTNLKSRNRKCPTCKKMYGQDDVKNVWFT